MVRLSDNFNSDVWPDLKCHILKNNPDAAKQVLYMCYYCKNDVNGGDTSLPNAELYIIVMVRQPRAKLYIWCTLVKLM